jgi:hypothetical protein
MRGDSVRLASDRFGSLNEGHHLTGDAAMQPDVLLEERENPAGVCLKSGRVLHRGRVFVDYGGAQVPTEGHISRDPRTRDAFDENLRGPVGLASDLENSRDHAHAMQIAGGWFIRVGISLRDEEEHPALVGGRFDRRQRAGATDQERHGDEREHNNVAQREHRQALGDLNGLAVANKDRHWRKVTPARREAPRGSSLSRGFGA